MITCKKLAATAVAVLLSLSSLTGCSSSDKSAAKEAAEGFMEAVKSGDTNAINTYSSSEVSSGSFVALFDRNYLKEDLTSKLGNPELNDETVAKLDELGALYSTLMEEYQITEVSLNDDGTATAYVTMKASFPYDIITSEETQAKFTAATDEYNVSSQDELLKITAEQGQDAAVAKAYNDIILLAVDIYEQAIESADPVSYLIALNIAKNEETGTWYVTSVQSYDSSIAGTGAPATDTDTSATESSSTDVPATEDSAAEATTTEETTSDN